jgi:hypothetical protein
MSFLIGPALSGLASLLLGKGRHHHRIHHKRHRLGGRRRHKRYRGRGVGGANFLSPNLLPVVSNVTGGRRRRRRHHRRHRKR